MGSAAKACNMTIAGSAYHMAVGCTHTTQTTALQAVPRDHIDDEYAHAGERDPKVGGLCLLCAL